MKRTAKGTTVKHCEMRPKDVEGRSMKELSEYLKSLLLAGTYRLVKYAKGRAGFKTVLHDFKVGGTRAYLIASKHEASNDPAISPRIVPPQSLAKALGVASDNKEASNTTTSSASGASEVVAMAVTPGNKKLPTVTKNLSSREEALKRLKEEVEKVFKEERLRKTQQQSTTNDTSSSSLEEALKKALGRIREIRQKKAQQQGIS